MYDVHVTALKQERIRRPVNYIDANNSCPITYSQEPGPNFQDVNNGRAVNYIDIDSALPQEQLSWLHPAPQYHKIPETYISDSNIHVPGYTQSRFNAPSEKTLQRDNPQSFPINTPVSIQTSIVAEEPQPTSAQQFKCMPSGRVVRMVSLSKKPASSPYATLMRQNRYKTNNVSTDCYEPQKFATVQQRSQYRRTQDIMAAFPVRSKLAPTPKIPLRHNRATKYPPITAHYGEKASRESYGQKPIITHYNGRDPIKMQYVEPQTNISYVRTRRQTPGWKSLTSTDMTTQ